MYNIQLAPKTYHNTVLLQYDFIGGIVYILGIIPIFEIWGMCSIHTQTTKSHLHQIINCIKFTHNSFQTSKYTSIPTSIKPNISLIKLNCQIIKNILKSPLFHQKIHQNPYKSRLSSNSTKKSHSIRKISYYKLSKIPNQKSLKHQ